MPKVKTRFLFLFVVLLVAGLYFFTRVVHLTQIPLFVDEAIYLRWAQIAKNDAAWRFISLTDGKQPMFVWLVMISLRFFADPLFAGRLVSVLVGLMTMIGLFFLGREVGKKTTIGLIAASLYLLFPFALVYDRMILMDSLVGMFAVWALYFEVLLVRHVRLDLALILGMIMGGAMLTKTSGFFNLYLLPFSLVLFDWKQKKWQKQLALWAGLAVVVAIESQIIYAILRLSPFFHIVGEKNTIFVYPLAEWLQHPWRFFIGNLRGLADWSIRYLTLPWVALVALSGVVSFKIWRAKLLLLIWFLMPLVGLALFGRILFPRFIFFMTLSLLPLIAVSLDWLVEQTKKRAVVLVVVIMAFLPALKLDWQIVADPYHAAIPKADSNQYLNEWPAGGGIKEAVAFFSKEAQQKKIFIATEGTFGLLPHGLEIYLQSNKNIEIVGFWPLREKIPEEVLAKAKIYPTFFVLNQTQVAPTGWPLQLVAEYRKGIGNVYMRIYKVIVP